MERWRQIAGFIGYEVSDLGRVRSLPRLGSDGRRWKGKILKATVGKHGYPVVGLSFGEVVDKYVHRLVLEAFRGSCPPDKEGCHNNGQRQDCRLDNLRWDTRKANAQDAITHGTRVDLLGEQKPMAKLTDDDVLDIRMTYRMGEHTHRSLGKLFGVSHSVIGRVIRKQAWEHIR